MRQPGPSELCWLLGLLVVVLDWIFILILLLGIDTDEIDNDVENFEEEVIEFLLSVEETAIEEEWAKITLTLHLGDRVVLPDF